MTFEEAKKKLEQYGQEHVLKYYDSLTDAEKENLITQIDETDFSVLSNISTFGKAEGRGQFAPLAAMELSEIEEKKDHFYEIGMKALEEGKAAALLLAGGMGTRLGSDAPKGTYDIGITRPVYIFQRQIENLLEVVSGCKQYPRLFIMTSEKNNDATVAFLTEHEFFGYPKERIAFFKQDMAPACDDNGKVYMEEKGRIATSPNGNAGWYQSLVKAGLDKVIADEKIEWINVFAVDNVLQRILDPVFIGATLEAAVSVGAKVVRKAAPDEKVGTICLEDGKPSIVEYYELSEEMMNEKNEKGDPAYNFGVILNYLFHLPELTEFAQKGTMLHVVRKKIPYMNEQGEFIKPESENGFKFEQLVLDMIHQLTSCLPYEVVREREFAPIKNKTGIDSVESARELCKKNGIEL
ncbi:MAG: UTP--glucose-1-phosphate uridylyltransferase [Lachnospiraceae bacterium]|nr:UTP--glucose-1-phosphate uridylyltransferase [Lachnospiraceae bacterium]